MVAACLQAETRLHSITMRQYNHDVIPLLGEGEENVSTPLILASPPRNEGNYDWFVRLGTAYLHGVKGMSH